MNNNLSNSALAWLLTYAIHSSVLLTFAWAVCRRKATTPSTRDHIWKLALVGGLVTASLQTALDLRPAGSLSLAGAPIVTVPRLDPSRLAAGAERDDGGVLADPSPNERSLLPERVPTTGSATVDTPPRRIGFETVLVIAWLVIGVVLAVGYAARRLILFGRLSDRRALTDGPLAAMLDTLRRTAGVRRRVSLTAAGTISSPVALGLGEICVPEAVLTDLDEDQQRGLLAHELAHLARRDPLWLDAASLLERIFFFQPLNRLARRELQKNAEFLCDDWAAAKTGSGGGRSLARCLARVAEWIEASPLSVPVSGMAEERSLLVSRIARLIEGRSAGSPAPRLVVASLSIVFLAAIVAAAPGVHRGTVGGLAKPGVAGASTGNLDKPEAGTPVDTAVVNALIERLSDSDAGVRKAAAAALGNLKSRLAVPGLIRALEDKNAEVRAAAANSLGDLGDDRAIAPLTALITDTVADVRETALNALSNFSRAIPVDPLIGALKDERANVREKAAQLLGDIGDRAAVAPLSRLLQDPSTDVRSRALQSLEEIKDPSAAPAITAVLHDASPDIRRAALSALHELGAPIPERAILDALGDESADVRQHAAQIAGEHPSPSAVPILRRMLDDSDGDVREAAVSALAQMRDPAAREALRAALKSHDPNVRKNAVEALGGRP